MNANGTTNGCSPLSSGSTSSTSTTSAASGSNSSGTTSLTCPTCIAFSDHCCQQENGMILFQEFIEANIHCCVWEQRLSDALASLRYLHVNICVHSSENILQGVRFVFENRTLNFHPKTKFQIA